MPSPSFGPRADGYHDTLGTPEPDSSAAFTYPPQSGLGHNPYDYVPTSASRSRPTSLLPLHHAPLSPLPSYPPLEQTWTRLKSWLFNEYPELGDTLNYGILPQDLANIEMQFGFALPQAVRESYLIVDGQEPESSTGCSEGLFFGLVLLPLEEVLEEWRFWREVDDDPNSGGHSQLRQVMQSIPPNWIRKEYSQRGWIPLITDKAGNYVGVDLNPGDGGSVGQVIVFGRDFDTKVVLWRGDGQGGWAKWLASFVEDLENGDGFELGGQNDTEGSEDDLGYDSYFGGRGTGDGNGDTGGTGLRLTGEYRGWNVFEAWADKSVKKWQESGVLTAPSPKDKGKAPERQSVFLDFAKSTDRSGGAEVAIPVFSNQEPHENAQPPPKSISQPIEVEQHRPRQSVPTISVTKPPAPLPVDLPTESDIIPSPTTPDSGASSPIDLESGRQHMMREINDRRLASSKVNPPVAAPTPSQPTNEAALIPLPVSPEPESLSSRSVEPTPSPAASAPLADITDLLADSAPPALDVAAPIEPSTSPLSSSPPVASPPTLSEHISEPAAILDEEVEIQEEETEPDTTVRLIGGGGTAGVIGVDQESTLVDEEDDTAKPEAEAEAGDEEHSEMASTNGEFKKKHEKKKSSLSSGLKKIGNKGGAGKRRKDSSTSAKDITV